MIHLDDLEIWNSKARNFVNNVVACPLPIVTTYPGVETFQPPAGSNSKPETWDQVYQELTTKTLKKQKRCLVKMCMLFWKRRSCSYSFHCSFWREDFYDAWHEGSSDRSISAAPVPATSCAIWASEEPPKLHSASPMRAAEVSLGHDHGMVGLIRLMEEIGLTTWYVYNLVNKGKNLPTSTCAGVLPSTVWCTL